MLTKLGKSGLYSTTHVQWKTCLCEQLVFMYKKDATGKAMAHYYAKCYLVSKITLILYKTPHNSHVLSAVYWYTVCGCASENQAELGNWIFRLENWENGISCLQHKTKTNFTVKKIQKYNMHQTKVSLRREKFISTTRNGKMTFRGSFMMLRHSFCSVSSVSKLWKRSNQTTLNYGKQDIWKGQC